ncbi:hypothetical protein KIN20_009444 [Parelaphostrongylus tenuis]|uniref:Uncharacterized protein n=1 Tax=Parelaphostrongylus tenuis TaxID=148309 RepID=A0AAD5QL94_PARTN|nr:hypothetical protein KIN20_009444 [Parelaphostrongylus tenuis]
MFNIFQDRTGPIHWNLLPVGETVNAKCYCELRGLLQSDPVTSTSSQSHPAGQRTATCRRIYKEEVDRTRRRGLTVTFESEVTSSMSAVLI